MNTRIFLAVVITVVSIFPAAPAHAASSRSVPSSLRETSALDSELARLKRESDTSKSLVRQLRNTTKSTRSDVELAIKVCGAIRSIDKRMVKLIDRLKPYLSIPKVRTIAKTLRNNLIRVQEKIHTVRKKTDKVEKSVLKPTRQKLVKLEGKLRVAESKISQVSMTVAQSRSQLSEAANLASNNAHTRRALEAASREVLPPTRSVTKTLSSVNGDVRSVVNEMNQFRGLFASFRTVNTSVGKLSHDLKPGEKVAADIDKVLSKRLSIRLPVPPFKKVGFSIRQILEKPGDVIGAVLKPLEKLVDKALQPLLKKTKLEIKAPAGLAALERSVDQLNAMHRQLTSKIDKLDAKLSKDLVRDADRFVSIAKQKLQQVASNSTHSAKQAPVRKQLVRKQQVRKEAVFFLGS